MAHQQPNPQSHIDDIRNTLSQAKRCHEVWWILHNDSHEKREEIVQIFDRYLRFFSVIKPALFTAFVIKFASLFETGDGITLQSVPDIRLGNENAFNDLWSKGRRLYKYRSKVIAHRDKNIDTKNFGFESGLNYNDLNTMLDEACRLFDSAANRNGIDGILLNATPGDLLSLVEDPSEHPKCLP